MANTYDKLDVYAIMNELVAQTMGADSELKVFDSTSFATVGAKLLSFGTEKTLNALTEMFAKTIFSVRPYKSKFNILETDNRLWGSVTRKITALYKELEQSTDNNTNLATPLANGESVDPWVINKPDVIETVFIGTNVIQKSITNFTQAQLNVAFTNESEFVAFLGLIATEFENELEKTFETEKRGAVLNYLGACLKVGMYKDLAEEFNKTYNTEYTRDELLTTYFENFAKFVIATLEKDSNILEEFSFNNHLSIDGYAKIPRHTPKADQRMLFYEPFFIDVKANVFSSLFHPELLKIGDYEKVNYWENINEPTKISVKPNYVNSDGESVGASTDDPVTSDYVLGVLYDRQAMGWVNIFEQTATTPINARGLYYNTFYHSQSKPWCDMFENGIVYIIGEGGTPSGGVTVSPVAQNRKLFEVTASTFQKNDIVVSDTGITGTLKEMTDSNPITDVWGTGYFIGLKFVLPEGCTSCKVGLNPSQGSGLVEIINDPDKDGVFKITDKDTQVFEVKYTVNGIETTKDYDLSGLTLE